MKQYKIVKIIYAESFAAALRNETKAEIVDIELNESVQTPNSSIGFKK